MIEGEIRKAVVVDAPPEVVFKALTDEKELVQWRSATTVHQEATAGDTAKKLA